MKKWLFLFLFSLIPLAVYAGGNDECVVSTDCRFLLVLKSNADANLRYTSAVAATGSADLNFGWFYEDDDALTDLADANEVDESTDCSGEVPDSGVCLEVISQADGLYVAYVDSLLLGESGKEFCLNMADGYASRVVNDVLLCKYVAPVAKHAVTPSTQNQITGGAYPLDTDANGRIRIVDGTGAGEIDTASGLVSIGNGSVLTDIPWNAVWDAEVESEANDALVVLHLDHLLAADYDPATKPGVATALFNELIEDDSGVSRYTLNALEQARGTNNALLATDTGSGFTAIPWNSSWDAEVESEVNDGLVAVGLDHLISLSYVCTDIADNSIIATILSAGATADCDTYDNTEDSLEALRNLMINVPTAKTVIQ